MTYDFRRHNPVFDPVGLSQPQVIHDGPLLHIRAIDPKYTVIEFKDQPLVDDPSGMYNSLRCAYGGMEFIERLYSLIFENSRSPEQRDRYINEVMGFVYSHLDNHLRCKQLADQLKRADA